MLRPPGADAELPRGRAQRARSREPARAAELADREVDGTHMRVLTQALPGGGAVQVARPLEEVDDQLEPTCWWP